MESPYVSLSVDNIDFTPLQEKIFTIETCKITNIQVTDAIQFFQANINDYIVKLRIKNSGLTIEGACACKDFIWKKKKQKRFCKHILHLYDYIKSENG